MIKSLLSTTQPRAAIVQMLAAASAVSLSILSSGCRLAGSCRHIPLYEPGMAPTNAVRVVTAAPEVKLALVRCEPGTFQMGSLDKKTGARSDEMPQHTVTLSKGFWIGQCEVTQKQWEAVMGINPSYNKKGGDYPVEQVSWNDCQAFVAKLSEMTGVRFRLPTEAEWEYACRAGTTSPYSSRAPETAGWFYRDEDHDTHPVACKAPNAWGIYDMHGNVAEWCQDVFSRYTDNHVVDPKGLATGNDRVFRGGSAWAQEGDARSACRDYDSATCQHGCVGLRVAADLD